MATKEMFKYEDNLKQLFGFDDTENTRGRKKNMDSWKESFIILGSAALKMQNLISESNHDIDILVYRNVMASLAKKDTIKESTKKSCLSGNNIYQDKTEKIDIISEETLNKIAPYAYWKAHIVNINGYQVIDPEANLTFYTGLYIRSKGKEKFMKRINQILGNIVPFIAWSKKSKNADWKAYFDSLNEQPANEEKKDGNTEKA